MKNKERLEKALARVVKVFEQREAAHAVDIRRLEFKHESLWRDHERWRKLVLKLQSEWSDGVKAAPAADR